MALYFNSLTGKIEDDGKDIQAPETLSIPSGRLADPSGAQDFKLPIGGIPAQRKYEQKLAEQQSLALQANPEASKFASIVDLGNMTKSFEAPKAELPVEELSKESPLKSQAAPKKASRSPAIVDQAAASSSEMNPKVKEYIKSKYGLLDPESYDAEMKKAEQDAKDRKSGLGIAQFIAGAGDAIAGRSPSESARMFDGVRKNIDADTTGKLETRRKAQMENLSSNSLLDKMQRDKDTTDPNSTQSQAFRKIIESKFPEVAKAYGDDWVNVSAADQELIFKPLQLKEQMDMRRDTARMYASQREDAKRLKQEEKLDKKKQAMFEIEDRRHNILANLDELDKMIDEDGTWEMFGSHNQDMERKLDQVATDMAKLMDPQSVARPAEVDLIKQSLVKSGFSNRNSTARDVLTNFKSEVQRRADTPYQIRGLEKPQQTGSFPRQVRKGNQTAIVSNEAELREAMSEGWK